MATATTPTTPLTATTLGKAPERRLVVVGLESRASRLGVLVAALAVAGWLAAVVLSPAVAWYLARPDTIPALERALGWDASNPEIHARLGHAYADLFPPDFGAARAHLESAARLRSTDAYPRLLLALLAHRERDRDAAHRALEAALRLDPHNLTIRWEAAVLHMAWGERDPALEHFKYVLSIDGEHRDAAFQLARTLLGPGEDPGTLLPGESRGLTNVLLAALRQEDLPLAQAAWSRRVALDPPLTEDVVKRYVNLLIDRGDGRMARRVWVSAVGDGDPAATGDGVWNGGFETERLQGWGLDWRVRKAWGVDVALDRFVAAGGSRSLRLAFNSFPTLDFAGVVQFVAVEPGRHYRLRALARAGDFTTQSGLKLQVVVPGAMEQLLAETAPISGTTADWVVLETSVTPPAGATLVLIKVRREPAAGPEGNLGGKVWLDEVTLQ